MRGRRSKLRRPVGQRLRSLVGPQQDHETPAPQSPTTCRAINKKAGGLGSLPANGLPTYCRGDRIRTCDPLTPSQAAQLSSAAQALRPRPFVAQLPEVKVSWNTTARAPGLRVSRRARSPPLQGLRRPGRPGAHPSTRPCPGRAAPSRPARRHAAGGVAVASVAVVGADEPGLVALELADRGHAVVRDASFEVRQVRQGPLTCA